jgi:flavodoxin
MTAKVAGFITDGMKEEGIEVTSVPVQDAKHVKVEEYDCLILGSPTMAWRPTKDVKDYLGSLSGKKFSGKMAASFDTQLKSAMSGNANKALEEGLTELGYTIACPHLQAYVHGKKDAYTFLDGEEEKAKKWGKDLAAALKK